jgi:sRNA-binding protein
MTETTKPKTFQEKIDQVIFKWLCVEYPNLFNVKKPKPLETGIGRLLQEQLPENITQAEFKLAVGWYCQRKEYFKAILNQPHRYDLNGEISSEISEEDKISANERLEKLKEKLASKQSAVKNKKDSASKSEPALIQESVAPIIETSEPVPAPISEIIESEPVKKTLSLKSKKTSTITEEVKPMTNTKSEGMATAKGLKVTLVIDPASLPNIDTTGMKKAPISIFISNGEITATTEINAKSYRKALSSIEEYGVDGCNVIVQGSMRQYGVIDDAGLVVQPKKQANSE